jgi:hypothetical protein
MRLALGPEVDLTVLFRINLLTQEMKKVIKMYITHVNAA